MKPLVFLCQPRYSGSTKELQDAAAGLALNASAGMCNVVWRDNQSGIGSPAVQQGSLLGYVFNRLWAMALNARRIFRVTHFAMVHADVEPVSGWLDVLVNEQRRLGADVISTVIPFKTGSGLTSTGLGDPNALRNDAGISGDSRRLTMREVFDLPETFSAADTNQPGSVLLLNTGCWVADLTKPWVDARDERGRARFKFTIYDDVLFDTTGTAHAETRGEDWNASYLLHDLGCRVFATRKVQVEHHGGFAYSNWPAWGEWETDRDYAAVTRLRAEKAAAPS